MIKSGKMGWECHIARMRRRGKHRILVGKRESRGIILKWILDRMGCHGLD
jgi:hypothetical protein